MLSPISVHISHAHVRGLMLLRSVFVCGDLAYAGRMYRVVQGKTYILEDDELLTEEDPKGNTKIDKNGNLLDGEFIHFPLQTHSPPGWRCANIPMNKSISLLPLPL